MAWVTVDRAEAGMALASPVTDRMGRLLIPAGAELSPRHVSALATWGVESIEIECDEPPEPMVDITPEIDRQARDELAARFRDTGTEHPFLNALFELAVERHAHALALAALEGS